MGQKFSRVGSPDPHKDPFGKIDFRIAAQMRAYSKADAPPTRVKPVPITLVVHALNFAYWTAPTAERQVVANLMCLAFFFCLWPGEYTSTTTDDQAFALDAIAFFLGSQRLHNALSTDHELEAATSMQLTFTTQKNGIRGDVIAHSRSRDPLCCPVTATLRQFMLHRHESLRTTTYYNSHHVRVPVTASMITQTMRCHAGTLEPMTGISPKHLSARSLRAGGAMALL